MRALYVAASGMNAQQTRIDVIANNLANVSTTGFKRSRGSFQDAYYQELTYGGSGASPARVDLGGGVQIAGLDKDHREGVMTETGQPLDIAINGSGWLIVEDQDGRQLYTRDGHLRTDVDGMLVNASGMRLAGGATIPRDAQSVLIGRDGTIQVQLAGDTEYSTVGQLQVATFVNPGGLAPEGNNLFAESPQSGEPLIADLGIEVEVVQGYLEGSNVDVAEELITMIQAQRAYELNSKVVQAADETLQVAANLRR